MQQQGSQLPHLDIPEGSVELCITGGPGCGKTEFLSCHIDQAQQDRRRPLILSHTHNTAAEVATRHPYISVSRIGTLHAICHHALGRPETAYSPEDIAAWNMSHPQQPMTNPLDRDEIDPGAQVSDTPSTDALMAEYIRRRATFRPLPDEGPLAHFAAVWTDWCQSSNRLDSTGVIESCIELNVPPPGSPGVIFVDEAQDLSPLELKLLRQWSSYGIPLVLAGDSNQNLYSWRGTDGAAFINSKILATERHRALTRSHRVPVDIHAAILEWMAACPTQPIFDYQPCDELGLFTRLDHGWLQPQAVVQHAHQLAGEDDSVMILASRSHMLRPTIAHLKAFAIPYHNRWRLTNSEWNPDAEDSLGVRPSQRILAFLGHDQFQGFAAVESALRWSSLLDPSAVFRQGAHGFSQLQCITPKSDDDTQADLLDALLTPQASIAAAAADLRWFEQNLHGGVLDNVRHCIAIAKERGRSALEAAPQMTVGTIHSVKGGECDHAIIYPDLDRYELLEWLGSPAQQAAIYRQFYVAMTRARRSVTICAPIGAMYVDL